MLNQVVIAGRIKDIKTEQKDGKNVAKMVVAVPRSYKNVNGEYETDFITCTLWDSIAKNTTEYCKTGDVVGVKGRINTTEKLNLDNSISYDMEVIAEKVSFLSSSKN